MLLLTVFLGKAQTTWFLNPYASGIGTSSATLNVIMQLDNTYQVGYQISTNPDLSSAPIQGQQNTTSGYYPSVTRQVTGLSAGTTYYFRFRALSGGNAVYSTVANFTTVDNKPAIMGYSTVTTAYSATINYYLLANNYNTTSVVKYGLANNALTNQVTGFSASGNSWELGNAEITGLAPNTQYFYQIEATNANGTVATSVLSFTTSTITPAVSNISTGVTTETATVNYTLNSGTANATSLVKYGLAANALTNQITGFSATANTNVSNNVQLSGLTPNTQYFYQIEATNSHGTVSSSVETFTTNQVFVPGIIVDYTFNNTYNNIDGNTPFQSNAGTSFTTDRHGNPNSAINIANQGATATIPNLPYGALPRTVSLWVKLNTMGVWNFLYSYGTAGNPEGAYLNASTANHYAPNNQITSAHSVNIWYHYVFSFDGNDSKIYLNGALIKTQNVTKNTMNNGNIFMLGLSEGGAQNYFNGAIDDLKIYNYALSDSEVANLYNSQTLSVTDFSKTQNAEVYPNPVKDILNITTSGTVKSVEIFNTSGEKVREGKSNQINMQKLPAGMYMVKITNSEGKTTTKKVIKN